MAKLCSAIKAAALIGTALCAPGIAWGQASTAALPVRTYIDGNGVDLFTGMVMLRSPILQAGASEHLRYYQVRAGGVGYKDNLQGAVTVSGTTVTVSIGEFTEQFIVSGSTYIPVERRGSTLTGGGTAYAYKTGDGTTYSFRRDPTCANCRAVYTQWGDVPVVQSIVYADGGRLDFVWQSIQTQVGQTPAGPALADVRRVVAIYSNDGYSLNFKFLKEPSSGDFTGSTIVTKATAFNYSQDGCSGVVNCTATGRPSLSISGTSYTDSLNRTTVVGTNATRRPGSTTDNVTYTYDGSGRVTQVAADGVTTTYGYPADAGDIRTVTVTRAGDQQPRTVAFNIAQRTMKSDTDPTGRKTSYEYDGSNRVTTITAPELNYTRIGYDDRGNATSTVVTGKSGGTLPTSATYPCTIAAACNSPMTSTDANNNVTNYDYDPSSGLPSKITAPAPVSGSVRPEKRMGYTQVGGVWRVTSTSECRTAAPGACTNGADETKATIAYAGSTALVSSVSVGAGDNTLTATTAMTYDAMGRLLTTDGPLPGADDTTRNYYDVEGQLLGSVGPDPDGAGALLRRAVRNTYNAAGQVTVVETGATADQSDTALTNMTVLQSATTTYDANSRKIAASMAAGGTTFAYSQVNYDGRGRINCTVTRMNPAAFTATADACTMGPAGSFGSDRITQTTYDDANRVLTVTTALQTPEASTERMTYTSNGLVASVKDGMSNLTENVYNEFDRVVSRQFPAVTQSANASNGNDHEEYGYDPVGNLTVKRVRDGRLLTFNRDALNRVVVKGVADGCATRQVGACAPASATRDVFYSYDLVGNLTGARFDSASGEGVSATYDALGRLTSSTTAMAGTSRTLTYQSDITGNRTRITHPDSVRFDMTYDVVSAMKNASWTTAGGTTPFMAITYDSLGRRTDINRASSNTGYAYDGASQLTSQNQRFAGGTGNVSTSFGYNPAGQIASQTRDNDAYAFTGAVNVDRPYVTNGLNQYTSAGPASFTYDVNGNLVSDGSTTYLYDAENRLIQASGSRSATLVYDPLGRLFETSGGSVGRTQFLYDASALVAEYDGSNGALRRRYMHGPGADEPILWDEGSAMNCSGTRFLHTDERGSVVAVADCYGNRTAVNTYDENGIPGAGNSGRFQYTGQAWIPELGLYYYKARMFSPTLGRFMQTDPIGYADGMNWYNYVNSDPINLKDPTGLATFCTSVFVPVSPGPAYPGSKDNAPITAPGYYKNICPSFDLPNGSGNNQPLAPPQMPSPPPSASPSTNPLPQKENSKKVHGPWTYGNYCGAGGSGTPKDSLDKACKAHDECYSEGGLSPLSNFSPIPDAKLQQCNQRLCDAAKGQGSAGSQIRAYFKNMPMPYNACRWDR